MNEATEGQEVDEAQDAPEAEADLVREAFDDAVAADSGEDDIKMQMLGAGATFKTVTRLYNKYMVDAGFAISKEAKDEIVTTILDGKDLADEDSFNKCVVAILKKAVGVTEKSAASLIRAYAKSKEIEYYTKPKGTGEGRVGFRSRFFDALKATPDMNEKDCATFLRTAEGTSNNVVKHESVYQGIRELVNNIHAQKAA